MNQYKMIDMEVEGCNEVPPAVVANANKKQKCEDDSRSNDVNNNSNSNNNNGVWTLDSIGISSEEVQCAVNVLNRIASATLVLPPPTRSTDSNTNTTNSSSSSSSSSYFTQCPELRPIRKAIAPFVDVQIRQRYTGKSPQEFQNDKVRKTLLQKQKMKETCEQRKYINSTQLRKGRIEKLNALLQKQQQQHNDEEEEEEEEEDRIQKNKDHPLQYLIPDGAVMDTNNGQSQEQEQQQEQQQERQQQLLPKLRSCYVCKKRFRELHCFYDQLCPTCASFNYAKRHQTVDVTPENYVAVVTGSRVKIGFHTCLKLLRAGCTVIATTRFPNTAVAAYRAQPDFITFHHRLHIYGLDLRDVCSIELFVQFLKKHYTHVDILINNACQTVRRPAGYYHPAIAEEQRLYREAVSLSLSSSNDSPNYHMLLLRHTKEFEQVLEQQRQNQNNNHQLLLPSSSKSIRNPTDDDLLRLQCTNSTTTTTKSNNNGVVCTAPSTTTATAIVLHNDNNNEKKSANDETTTSNKNSSMPLVPSSSSSSLSLFESTGISHSAAMSQMTVLLDDVGLDTSVLPEGFKDINGQQLDLRRRNSWLLKMEEVSTPEVVETMFINAIAPFILNSKLKPLMTVGNTRDRFIINVSAMEGKFYRYKTPNHPHTNMAKAALNMLTRTSAEDLATNCRIYMNSVDTGWINDENPLEKASKIAQENHFQTPIDEVDAASRILDPIFSAISGETTPPAFGMFFKDYKPTEW